MIASVKFHHIWFRQWRLPIAKVALAVVGFVLFFMPSMAHATPSATLAWDANPENDISGYRIHYGTQSGVYSFVLDVGNETTARLVNLAAGTNYFCAVSAYNAAGGESSLSAEINFSTPLDVPLRTYAGLVSNDVPSARGLFTMTKGAADAVSGRVGIGALRYSWKGIVAEDGTISITIRRTGLRSLVLSLRVSDDESIVAGTLTDGVFTSTINAALNFVQTTLLGPAELGVYTAVLSPESTDGPQGHGVATIKVSKTGSVRMVATLADGTRFTASSQISDNGSAPFHALLNRRVGAFLCNLRFRDVPDESDADASVVWNKSAAVAYPLQLRASRYMRTTPLLASLARSAGVASLLISSDEIGSDTAQVTMLSATRASLSAPSGGTWKITFAPAGGTFSGSRTYPGRTPIPFWGVLFQKGGGRGLGWIQSASASGRVTFAP